MRLINCTTYKLEEFFGSSIPPYAILSHTWGNGEVTFVEFTNNQAVAAAKAGWGKILLTCEQALTDGIRYAWVDTCCIDKSSSAELSEAINSMFAWYQSSTTCYAYIADVDPRDPQSELSTSNRWFQRGWTLQELLAPTEVTFYDKKWNNLGTRSSLARLLAKITMIDESALVSDRPSLNTFCVARKMSWASGRETTRVEDIAYSLLGIFDISMPLLYGEGERAFVRLQEEIIKRSNDDSIFAWGLLPSRNRYAVLSESPRPSSSEVSELLKEAAQSFLGGVSTCVLAKSPKAFNRCHSVSHNIDAGLPFNLTNVGLQFELPCVEIPGSSTRINLLVGLLNCSLDTQPDFIGILLFPAGINKPDYQTKYVRSVAVAVEPRLAIQCEAKKMTIVQGDIWAKVTPRSHIATRGRRILVTTSPAFEAAGLRIVRAEGVLVRHLAGDLKYTSDWDATGKLLWVDCSAVAAILLRFQVESWDKRPSSTSTIFARTATVGCVLQKGSSFTEDAIRYMYHQLGVSEGEQHFMDSNLVEWHGAKLQLMALLKPKSIHSWKVHELTIDVRDPNA